MRRIATTILAASLLVPAAVAEEPVREGTGERREQLDAMELEPFPFDELSGLEGWIGEPVSGSDVGGKVVLVVTWASWYPVSVRALSAAEFLHDRYADQGLVVVGVHHPDGWDRAGELAERRRVSFPIGHDADGSFREALLVDQDPDHYLADRAGQLRYADVDSSSVERAIQELLGEGAGEAGSLKGRIAERKRQEEIEFSKTAGLNQAADLRNLPPLPFADPPAMAYELARWPKEPEDDRNRYRRDEGPRKASLPGPEARWEPAPPNVRGKAVVVYFWHPAYWQSTGMTETMDQLQRRYLRDVVVVGVLTSIPDERNRRDPDAADPNDPEQMRVRFSRLVDSREFIHPLTIDLSSNVYNSVNPEGQRGREIALPYAGVISTDGVVRWWGDPESPGFEAAIEQVIKADPGVQARRKAEEAYLKANRNR